VWFNRRDPDRAGIMAHPTVWSEDFPDDGGWVPEDRDTDTDLGTDYDGNPIVPVEIPYWMNPAPQDTPGGALADDISFDDLPQELQVRRCVCSNGLLTLLANTAASPLGGSISVGAN
jgi:hypothetical protein